MSHDNGCTRKGKNLDCLPSCTEKSCYDAELNRRAISQQELPGIPDVRAACMTLKYEGHAETLSYGWWERKRGHVLLPATLKDKRNFVLTLDELREVEKLTRAEHEMLETRLGKLKCTIRALEKGYHSEVVWGRETPTCFTLAHMMQWLVDTAKHKLAATEWAVAMLRARRDTLAPGPNQQQGATDETSSGGA